MNGPALDLSARPVGDLLADLAAKRPVPGGGAAAGIVTATAAGLASMVVAYSVGRKSLVEHQAELAALGARLESLRLDALAAAEEDATAYAGLQALWSLDRDDPVRVEKWAPAVEAAISAPRRIMAIAVEVLEIAERLEDRSNRMLRSDLAIAATLADAGHRSGAANVRINLPLLEDDSRLEAESRDLDAAIDGLRRRAERLERACR